MYNFPRIFTIDGLKIKILRATNKRETRFRSFLERKPTKIVSMEFKDPVDLR